MEVPKKSDQKSSSDTPKAKLAGEVVIEALKKAGVIRDESDVTPEILSLISETNLGQDFLKQVEAEEKDKQNKDE